MSPVDDRHEDPLAAADAPEERAPEERAPEPAGSDAQAELARERDDYLARWQRATADYKNLRRRTADEIEAAVRRATSGLLSNLLLVLDHLELALRARVESPDARALCTGVELTRDQLLQVLEQQGVAPIDAAGPFDPARHEAVSARVEPGAEPGTILEVVRRGYTWRDQVLRPAHVVVARGPLESSPAADRAPESEREA